MLTSLFSRLVLTFGDRSLPHKTVVEEIVTGILVVVPFGVLLGQLIIRLSCHPLFRAEVYNTLLRLLVVDLTMEILLPSVQCLALDNGPGYSLELLAQNWGWCGESEVRSPSDALSPRAMGYLFGMRLFFVCLGVHLGESFVPIALSGGIACGKSTVAKLLLSEDGGGDQPSNDNMYADGTVYMVDTDKIAHEILIPGGSDSVHQRIVNTFGESILEDASPKDPPGASRPIDRRKLGAVIFQDREKRSKLNSMTHPRIIYIMIKRLLYGLYLSNKDLTVADVPLLYESGKLRWMFGISIVVACSPELQLERLKMRNPDLSEEQCRDRIASQMKIEDKAKLADLVIWNNGSLEDLEEEVEDVRQEIMKRVYGVGLSLLQLLIIIGGSVPLAVMVKYTMQ